MADRIVCMFLPSLAVAATPLSVSVDTTTADFNVSLNHRLWLRGAPPTVGWGDDTELRLDGHKESNGTHSTLGDYHEIRFFWTATDNIPVQTAVQIFDDANTALLVQVVLKLFQS